MKKLHNIMKNTFSAAVVVCLVLTLCSFSLENLTFGARSSVSEATAAGESCGRAVKELYAQYKTDGTLDFSNASNLINLASLTSSLSIIRNQDKDTDFYKEFAAGVLSGASRSAKDVDVEDFIDALSSVDLTSISVMQQSLEKAAVSDTVSSAVSNVKSVMRKVEKENDNEEGDEAVERLTKVLNGFFAEKNK